MSYDGAAARLFHRQLAINSAAVVPLPVAEGSDAEAAAEGTVAGGGPDGVGQTGASCSPVAPSSLLHFLEGPDKSRFLVGM